MESMGELAEKIIHLDAEVRREVDEPERSALLGIIVQLQFALEALQAHRIANAREIVALAERLTRSQLGAIKREILPPRPPDASDALVLDRKADLIRLLDLQRSGQPLEDHVLALAWEAIRDRDELTTYCLASGPMDFYFRSRQADANMLRGQILDLLGSGSGAQVLDRLVGPTGVTGLLWETRRAVLTADLPERARPEPQPEPESPRPHSAALGDRLAEADREELARLGRQLDEIAAMANRLWTKDTPAPPPEPEQPTVGP